MKNLLVEITCAYCGKKFLKNKYEYARRINKDSNQKFYCSHICASHSFKNPPSICTVCGKEYPCVSKNKPTKYCSRACSNKGRIGSSYVGEQSNSKVFNVKSLKFTLAIRDGGFCSTCKCENFAIIDVHHKIPRAKGGTDELDNLILLCKNCHYMQHHPSFTFEEFKAQFTEERQRMMIYRANLELQKHKKEERKIIKQEREKKRLERLSNPKPKKPRSPKKYVPSHPCSICGKETTNKHFCSHECAQKNTKRFDVSKEELQSLIDQYPMSTIAKMLGVSDNAVKKRAKSLGIEIPARRGFWAKLKAGKIQKHKPLFE